MGRNVLVKAAVPALLAAAMPAQAQLYATDPVYPAGPIEASDPLVGVAIPGATPAEYRAHLLWNLRSGLNVAALQCQFSPYLQTVSTYNGLINGQHSRELTQAYTALEGYFRRTHGRTGPRRFDDYSTQTYNNFSTLHAQNGFCQTAARIAKEAMTVRRGELAQFATARMREFRGSLVPVHDQLAFTREPIRLSQLALGPRDCSRLPRSERRQCQQEQRR